jgi:anthranilate synthase component II
MIDNYDSFTYNLVQLISCHGVEVIVRRNDEIDLQGIESLEPDSLCISPGPGRPDDSGISKTAIRHFEKKLPILGVCLGMQAMNEVYGGTTVHAPLPVHGKRSRIAHRSNGILKNIPSPFFAARYHSLVCGKVGKDLHVLAKAEDRSIMVIQHQSLPLVGCQFHPESFLTEHGDELIRRFLSFMPSQRRSVTKTK